MQNWLFFYFVMNYFIAKKKWFVKDAIIQEMRNVTVSERKREKEERWRDKDRVVKQANDDDNDDTDGRGA